ncbi:hypothetical protein [uncultured Tenacibaculum sp.]|uniref:hypothetical protein n=1 Tax=uncultured Tenacibaculum sp. TaxID=174713 RepID=UPI0026024B13|nr:hypothetical protein [uncultured Tenacibaculum sp.]
MRLIFKIFVLFLCSIFSFCSSDDKLENVTDDEVSVGETPSDDTTSESTTSITKGGITWSFDETQTGRFLDGSPWIISDGNIKLTATLPVSKEGRNGGFVNPDNSFSNGSDDRMKFNDYKHEENVTSLEKLPINLLPGNSYLQTKSKDSDAPGDNSDLEEIQVLTVLDVAPPIESFRPPYSGTLKPIYKKSDIKWSNLLSYTNTANTPSIEECLRYFSGGPYMKIKTGFADRYWHADANHPNGEYGREIAKNTGKALIRAMLEGTQSEKEELVIALIQAGIDCYGAAKSGLSWDADGGHNQGAKMLILFAGKMLESQELLEVANWEKTDIFQEDQQAFYINQEAVDISNGNGTENWDPDERNGAAKKYEVADIGRPEWGIRHYRSSKRSDMAWHSRYRQVSGSAQFSHCVAAYLMDVQKEWNHSAWFDYFLNRYYIVESGNDPATKAKSGIGNGANSITTFASEVYLKHINPIPSNTVPAKSSIDGVVLGKVSIIRDLEPR